MKLAAWLAAVGLALLAAACGEEPAPQQAAAEAPVVVAAASSLTDVMKIIGQAYAAEGHPEPRFSFAASSELARQAEQGAAFDVIISADAEWIDYLAARNLIDPASRRIIATNTLVLIAPTDAAFALDIGPGMDLAGAIQGGRLAIANPDGVPAGKYARAALETFGAWAPLEGAIARTENVRAALRFVEQGEAAAGIVYETDARAAAGEVTIIGRFPASSHAAIVYPAAVLRIAKPGAAQGFLEFLGSPKALGALSAAGFGPPG